MEDAHLHKFFSRRNASPGCKRSSDLVFQRRALEGPGVDELLNCGRNRTIEDRTADDDGIGGEDLLFRRLADGFQKDDDTRFRFGSLRDSLSQSFCMTPLAVVRNKNN